ncbi:MAG: ABC transporter ATP-binding protein [Proteobacteria bacterium]|nr:ABC transporter ATP-binding protein [Pseudomonadota bacterium]MBU1581840.1 ABC transporter ATP-binding protein [Pseudomonadota bacterium]MBU2628505.1 ABC transporter ATP-binding protein [Pseudomonadota bacterium]
MSDSILSLDNVHTHIGRHHILQGVSLTADKGGATLLLGRNGAGKSTTLRTIMGLCPASTGRINFKGTAIENKKTHEIARMGMGFVPEDRAVLFNLTVEENFRLSMIEENEKTHGNLNEVLKLFPALKKFWKTKAGLLSGGQKQMLAIARVFVCDHALLLIDEPSKGLAPIVVDQLGEALLRIKDQTKIILVEQNFNLARQVGSDCFILDDGRVVFHGLIQDLAQDKTMMKKYLGI